MFKLAWLRHTLIPGLVMAMPVAAQSSLNMTEGVTAVSRQVYDLHMTILLICALIGLVVFGLMFWSMWRHRKSRGEKPATFHENTKVEILWTLIPFLILLGMAVPATKTLIQMEDTSDADLTVLITGSQWKWHYRYFDQDVEFFSRMATPIEQIENKLEKGENYLLEVDRPLVLPIGQKVRFLVTSDDVIHSWWIPDFAVKKDANPGFINEAWTRIEEPGIYRGQCAELCGKDHGFMPVVVIAKEPAAYEIWLASERERIATAREEEQRLLAMDMSQDQMMDEGQRTYIAYCAACHQSNGEGLPGVFPAIKGSSVATGDLTTHLDIVVNGKTGTAMQAFGSQLSLSELAAVVTYQRNAWGNETGDLVQARDVQSWLDGN